MFIKCQYDESNQIYKILKEQDLPLEFYIFPSKELTPKYKTEWTPMKNVLVLFNEDELFLIDLETLNFNKKEIIPNIYKYRSKCKFLDDSDFSLFRARFSITNSKAELDIVDKYIISGVNLKEIPMKQRQEEYHDNRINNFGIEIKFSRIVFLDSELETLYGVSYYTSCGKLISNFRIDSTISESRENVKSQEVKQDEMFPNLDVNQNLKEFELRSSSFPECYFLYSLETKQKVGLALIDSYECSQWIKMLLNKENERKSKELSNKNALNESFRECSISTIIKIKCYYNKERSGWIPIKM